jgi:hypothetical protein
MNELRDKVKAALLPYLNEEFELLDEWCGDLADAAIATVMEATGWQPIVGCPKDGRVVMLTSDSPLWKYPFPAKWCDKQLWWVFADEWMNDCCAVSDLVSHWQPATSPPPPFEGTKP